MKHLILSLTLGLAIVGANSFALAQETEQPQESVEQSTSENKKIAKVTKGEFKIDLSDDQEKLDKVVKFVSEVVDEDVANELSMEFKTLDKDEKEELVHLIENGFEFGLHSDSDGSDNSFSLEYLLPALIIAIICSFPILLVLVLANSGQKKRVQKMELVSMYLQADRELPPHVINSFEKGGSDSSLRSGLVLAAIGLGFVIALNVSDNGEAAAFGFIPMFIGIARLIFWFFEERKYMESYSSKDNGKEIE